uniref:G_PROTEIN_RECEP_F1_2 domain-containing protein n=1 Tax=Angiostrongylus cantonensis TaxID=6313 RepID=A0A0K0DQB5_ANGCA
MSIENVTDTILVGGEVAAHPPEPIFSDYLEMTTLVLMFIIGAPLNLAAYTQVVVDYGF